MDTPTIRLPLGKFVLAVELYDVRVNVRLKTFHREGSRCTFSEEFLHDSFQIVLRLDWGDLVDGEPTLDMDVMRRSSNWTVTKIKPKNNVVHHTRLTEFAYDNAASRVYDLKFEGLHMRLLARKTFASRVGLSVYVDDSDLTAQR